MKPDHIHVEALRLDLASREFKPATIKDYLSYLKDLPEGLDRRSVQAWIQQGSTLSTRRHRYLAINALCRMLVADKELESNPCESISMPKEPEKPQLIAEDDHIAKLLATCGNNFMGIRDRAVIEMLRSLGCRRSELAGVLVGDVNLEAGQVLIRDGKNNTFRVAYLDLAAKKAVLRYLRVRRTAKPTLFGMSSNAIKCMVRKRRKEAGVPLTSHSFRRKMATDWLDAGGSQVGLMDAAGWRSITMPVRYTKAAAQKIAEAEFRKIQGRKPLT